MEKETNEKNKCIIENNEEVKEVINALKDVKDPLGSYTGNNDEDETPTQDAGDL